MPRPARTVTVRVIGKPSDAGLAAIAGLLLRREAERPQLQLVAAGARKEARAMPHNAQVQASGATKINEGKGGCSVSPATEG